MFVTIEGTHSGLILHSCASVAVTASRGDSVALSAHDSRRHQMGYRIMGRAHAARAVGARHGWRRGGAGDGRVRRPDPARRRAVRDRRARGRRREGRGHRRRGDREDQGRRSRGWRQEGLSAVPTVAPRRRAPTLAPWPHAPRDPRERPIAVFDSGVGGLTVLHELLVQLPARGLPVPRRHGAAPLRRPHAGRARALRAADRRGAAGARREAARRRLQLGDGGGAAGAARADGADDARRRRARRRAARGGPGRRGDAQRAHRAAGDAGDGGQRRVRVGHRAGRPARATSPPWRART